VTIPIELDLDQVLATPLDAGGHGLRGKCPSFCGRHEPDHGIAGLTGDDRANRPW
jgi:hypothetical protein